MVANVTGKIRGHSNRGTPLVINNVLSIPELRDNLMSVKKLTSAGIHVSFGANQAVLKKDGEIVATAKQRGGLYELKVFVEQKSVNACEANLNVLWYRRLCHLSQQGMRTIVKNNLATGMDIKADRLEFCDACVRGKMCREPFHGTRIRATRPLERIHSDVWGPIGSRFFVSLIDDHTHFAVVYSMRRKSEVFKSLREFPNLPWIKDKGIQIEPTVAYTPQQNICFP
ncbi:uncharacterized protein LOC129741331 [Uranotaenia lowii]|uniref:uncharacterized protein LOC129741331 n=1 Tax=Uranotaenia lowii TaxID=190385 RepID=UPI00247A561B|nr:uncharacterized protein LOC129741331 [Uranotaenia lowii]